MKSASNFPPRRFWLANSGTALIALARHVAPPLFRIALALPFFRSGLTRWDAPFQLSIGTSYLFEEFFKLHIFGNLVDIPFPDTTALIVACLEILLPVLLIFGLATRAAAVGIFIMTCVIQLIVPDGWANFHLYWAALALGLIAYGPGALSIDALIAAIVRYRTRKIKA
ncbi:DoxX family protein [soil metagenome]